MKSSERVRLIKEISAQLSKEERGVINLTLKQFKFPIRKSISDDRFSYVLDQIQNGTDSQLQKIASHIKDDIHENGHRLNPSFWNDGYFRVFISHHSEIKRTASLLKIELENYGISSFVAHSDIKPTRQWQDEIELALKTCNSLVALMNKGFHKSKWTDQEIGFAYGQGSLIIPVNLGERPYGFLAKFQVHEFEDVKKLALEIFETLASDEKTKIKIAYAAMRNFELSSSFAKARENLNLLRKVKFWDKTLLVRLKGAKNENRQILESIGVPERIDSLISKLKKRI